MVVRVHAEHDAKFVRFVILLDMTKNHVINSDNRRRRTQLGKRSDFDRMDRDFYVTPFAAVKPLFPFLPTRKFYFTEPCAGDGALVSHIETGSSGRCAFKSDLEPDGPGIMTKNALQLDAADDYGSDLIITNTPWDRSKKSGQIMHRMIEHFTTLRPSWLLFDSDWMQTVQAAPYLNRLLAVVSIGRVKWFPESTMTGKDNCQFHLFHKDARKISSAPLFFGRGEKPYAGFADAYLPPPKLKEVA